MLGKAPSRTEGGTALVASDRPILSQYASLRGIPRGDLGCRSGPGARPARSFAGFPPQSFSPRRPSPWRSSALPLGGAAAMRGRPWTTCRGSRDALPVHPELSPRTAARALRCFGLLLVSGYGAVVRWCCPPSRSGRDGRPADADGPATLLEEPGRSITAAMARGSPTGPPSPSTLCATRSSPPSRRWGCRSRGARRSVITETIFLARDRPPADPDRRADYPRSRCVLVIALSTVAVNLATDTCARLDPRIRYE